MRLNFAVFADTTVSTKIIQRNFPTPMSAHLHFLVKQMEPRNLFNENFVDRYPRNLSLIWYYALRSSSSQTSEYEYCILWVLVIGMYSNSTMNNDNDPPPPSRPNPHDDTAYGYEKQ